MSIPKLLNHKNYMNKSTSATPTTKGDMYQLFDNYGTVMEGLVTATLWQPATAYTAGAVVTSPSLPVGYVARCKTAGTSSEEEPSWKAGDITDNGVTWTVTKAVMNADKATSDEAKAGTSDKIITASALKDAMDAAISSAIKTATAAIEKQAKLDAHPVGSYYFSDDSTSPATLFGGTWEALPAGYTLIAQGSGTDDFGSYTYTAGQKYGERMHKLTVEEMPSHSHQQYVTANPGGGPYSTRMDYDSDEINLNTYPQVQTGSTGGSQAHNLVQPSIAAYGWRRTA
jgi:hypothetical protein